MLLVCVALQGAWPPWLRICGQPPNMVVAAVACIGLVKGARDGCLAGLVSAVLVAGAEQAPLGGLCVGFMVVGAGAGLLRGSLFAERLVVAVLVAFAGVVVSSVLRAIFMPPPEFFVWTKGVASSCLLTVVMTPPVFWMLRLARERQAAI